MADRLGTQVGNYRLTQVLGQGGFAEVYLGEHIHLGTQAAIKLLHAPLAQAPQVEAFREEARRIAQLSHPHIVRVLDFGFEEELPFLVLEYAPGGSLRQRHPVGTPVPLATVLTYVKQIAQGLQYAHDQQVIHRDLKPQNLLVGRHGEVLLADFGISVVAESTSRQSSKEFAGTVAYAAPEQIQGHPRPASDQYALGVVVYEWLTGQLPFTGSLMEILWKQVQVSPPPLRTLMPSLPPAVEQVVLTTLAKEPRLRFATVQAFATALVQASQPTAVFLPAPIQAVVPPPALVVLQQAVVTPLKHQEPLFAAPVADPIASPLLPTVLSQPMQPRSTIRWWLPRHPRLLATFFLSFPLFVVAYYLNYITGGSSLLSLPIGFCVGLGVALIAISYIFSLVKTFQMRHLGRYMIGWFILVMVSPLTFFLLLLVFIWIGPTQESP